MLLCVSAEHFGVITSYESQRGVKYCIRGFVNELGPVFDHGLINVVLRQSSVEPTAFLHAYPAETAIYLSVGIEPGTSGSVARNSGQ
jgi:hypothetical protein